MNTSLTVIILIAFVVMALVVIALVIWVAMLSGRIRRLSDMFIDFQTKSQTSVHVRQLSGVQQPEITTIEQVQNTVAQTRAEHEEQVEEAKKVAKVRKAQAQHARVAQAASHAQSQAMPTHAQATSAQTPAVTQSFAAQSQAASTQAFATQPQAAVQAYPGMQSQATQAQMTQSQASLSHGQTPSNAYAAQSRAVSPAQAATAHTQAFQAQTTSAGSYAFDAGDEDDNDFFEGYRRKDPADTGCGRRNKPTIPFGKDKDKIDKQESYVRDAVDNDFDPDSIDFSRVVGYKNRLKK